MAFHVGDLDRVGDTGKGKRWRRENKSEKRRKRLKSEHENQVEAQKPCRPANKRTQSLWEYLTMKLSYTAWAVSDVSSSSLAISAVKWLS
jgi:hypothetical protein